SAYGGQSQVAAGNAGGHTALQPGPGLPTSCGRVVQTRGDPLSAGAPKHGGPRALTPTHGLQAVAPVQPPQSDSSRPVLSPKESAGAPTRSSIDRNRLVSGVSC